MKQIFNSTVSDEGKLQKNVSNQIAEYLINHKGKRITISIDKAKKERSGQQNAYYWGCLIPILRNHLIELGNKFSIEQVHDLLKFKFLKEAVRVNEDEFIDRIKSTTELTTTQFMEYILEIQKWCSEMFDLTIPNPNEQVEIEL